MEEAASVKVKEEKKINCKQQRKKCLNGKLTANEVRALLTTGIFCEHLFVENVRMWRLFPGSKDRSKTVHQLQATIKKSPDEPEELLHLIVKMTPGPHADTDEFHDENYSMVHEREMFFYENIVPVYAMVEETFNSDNNICYQIFSKYCGSSLSLKNNELKDFGNSAILVLEDLKVHEFYQINNKEGLDLEHARIAVKALAQFHAVGMRAKYDFDETKARLNVHAYDFEAIDMNGVTKALLLLHHPYLGAYPDILKAYLKSSMDYYKKNLPDKSMLTLTHGKLTTIYNMFFHRNGNVVDDVVFVDYVEYLLTSPFRDLCNFICCCLKVEVMEESTDDLLDIYYTHYIEFIKKLNMDIGVFNRNTFDNRLKYDAIYELSLYVHLYGQDKERMKKIAQLYIKKRWIDII